MKRPASAAGLLAALAAREPTALRVAVVVAHPDDETIGAGASLALLRSLVLVHVTDGAPRSGHDARVAGHATAVSYAAARRAELRRALDVGAVQADLVELGVADQGATVAMATIAWDLAALFEVRGVEVVLTHPYEGGHPDHDAAAWAVHAAARFMPAGPAVLEMLSYHAAPGGEMEADRFLPGPAPLVVALTLAESARKAAMLACFTSQREVLAAFGIEHEAFRPAPDYDFAAPPHPGPAYYDGFDWGMTSAAWRDAAQEAHWQAHWQAHQDAHRQARP